MGSYSLVLQEDGPPRIVVTEGLGGWCGSDSGASSVLKDCMVGMKARRRAHPVESEGEGSSLTLSKGSSRGPIDSPEFPKLQRSVPPSNAEFAPLRIPSVISLTLRFHTHLHQPLQPSVQWHSVSLDDLHTHSTAGASAFQDPLVCSRLASSSANILVLPSTRAPEQENTCPSGRVLEFRARAQLCFAVPRGLNQGAWRRKCTTASWSASTGENG